MRTVNPLTALSLGFTGWIVALGMNRPEVSACLVVVALIIGTARTRNFSVPASVLALSAPVAVSMLLVHAPFGKQRIAPLITADGVAQAGEMTLRFMALMSCLIAAMTFVKIPELVKAVQISPLGSRAAYIVGSSLQFLPQGKLTVTTARDANQLRGRRITMSSVVPAVVLPVITGLLTHGAARGQFLETTGYDVQGRRTVLRPAPDSTAQRFLRWTIPVVTLAVVIWI
ncbi:energy-coupling factor transporter transmembrane component T [Corynebacterium breve]|uniref:Energy-coupling factor transporter transmembrane component T n=1 Tax=Corynebacterium breve TaxID=3049799 RepID=A0ABY8VIK7_9CORY|nr:energy-coupling factor transporter transmembrane component T [Corynebacterium breve]WIM68590.1 energy-coupling factor transporter transmembrane component T [Corynebacterium breve]